MTGPQPAGRPWTQAEEAQLRQLIISKVKVGLIAKKLKRSPGAIYARMNSIKKKPVDLAFGEQRRSVPSDRLAEAAHELSQLGDLQLPKTAEGMSARTAPAPLNSRTETHRRREGSWIASCEMKR